MKGLVQILGLVVLMNAVVFMWPKELDTGSSNTYPPRVDVNGHLIRLNKEIEARQLERASAKEEAANRFGNQQCYRLGPFSSTTNFEIAKATLTNAGVEYVESRRASQRSEVYRVFVGPFASKAEAADARTQLSNKGILDHFVREDGPNQLIVSLGIFTSLESANLGLAQLSEKVTNVTLRDELVTLPQTDWLYFSLENKPEFLVSARSIDWGEPGALLGRYTCQ